MTPKNRVTRRRSARRAILPAALRIFWVSLFCAFFGMLIGPVVTFSPSDDRGTANAVAHKPATTAPEDAPTSSIPVDSWETAIRALRSDYYPADIDGARARTLTYQAIRGMMSSLRDPYSAYLDPAEWNRLVTMTEGQFGGIGALMERTRDGIRVARPLPGGPAEKAGVKAGDTLTAIDKQPVKGKSLEDLGKWVEGQQGTEVLLSVMRGGTLMEFRVQRANIEPPVVEQWMEDPAAGIGHIVLTEFNRRSASQIEAAYRELDKKGLKALVLDLRFNPGGLLDAAVDVASQFVPENTARSLNNNVVIIRHADGEEEGLPIQPRSLLGKKIPLAVLVNGSSASAAEIVIGALRDYGVAEVIGERTFGKGKVQTLFEMNHGRDGGIRLTTSLYFPPKGYDINFKHDDDGNRIPDTGGIVPDIHVDALQNWTSDFEDRKNDRQLACAVEFLRRRLAGRNPAEAASDVAAVYQTPTRTARGNAHSQFSGE